MERVYLLPGQFTVFSSTHVSDEIFYWNVNDKCECGYLTIFRTRYHSLSISPMTLIKYDKNISRRLIDRLDL